MTPGPHRGRSFPEALAYASRGLGRAARTQRHFRVQLALAAAAFLCVAWAGVPTVEVAVLAVTAALVLSAELLNTAIELLTDLLHPDHGSAAAVVKDISAGAVLTAAVCALAVGLLLLLPHIAAVPQITTRSIATALGAACLILLVVGAVRRAGASGP